MGAALFVGAANANADGSTVITAGPGQYSIGSTHPTGTISIGGGTISARCTAQAFKGSASLGTPRCATRVVNCPTTASSCDVVWNARESALRGPVAWGGILNISPAVGTTSTLSPYNCPQAYSCGARFLVTGVLPGASVQALVQNIAFAPNYPNVFNQVSLTVH